MSQRCHEHIREVRHRTAAAVIHTGFGFVRKRVEVVLVRTKVEIGHREFAEQSHKEAGFVHRIEVGSGRKAPGSDRKAQGTVEADRIGSGHTAAAVLVEVVGEVCCSLGREAGRRVSEMIEDIVKLGRESVAVDHREQEKNRCQCSAVLVREVATGRASWQKVDSVGAGERRSPRRQGMLGRTWFQRELQS